jgi:DNA-binding beta-propeller fold protein YncE
MTSFARSGTMFVAAIFLVASVATAARAQSSQYPKPTELPNPYRLVEGWPTLPESMNGGRWGEVIRVHVHSDGNIWVFHRCFNTVPPGIATCVGRGDANPPILQFDPSGKLLKSLGGGMFVNPHGFTVDHEGNLWVSDVNDKETVLGMSTRNAAGVVLGQEVLKLDQNGKVLMMLGKMGVGGRGTDTFDRPTGVAIAANGDIFVSDGHGGNASNNARVVKFSKDGRFIKTWGHNGSAPGDFDDPHDIAVGGSLDRVYVADRRNSRIQVFDHAGNFIAAWHQFGQPSSVFIAPDDKIYVGAAFRDEATRRNPSSRPQPGELRGIMVGNAIDGSLLAFIPDPSDLSTVGAGTSASGIAADAMGNVYAADVGAHKVRKYIRLR